jgi:CheY-like chemotaxis protein
LQIDHWACFLLILAQALLVDGQSPTMRDFKTLFRPNILLIDDSIIDLRLLMEMMTVRKFRVSVCMNGKDGVMRALVQQPDLILLDVRMPGIDGFATCRLLKADERTRYIPVIFLSAATDPQEKIEGLKLGAVDYVTKPFDETEVITRVGIHLDIARRLVHRAPPDAPGEPPAHEEPLGPDALLVNAAVTYLRQYIADPPSPEQLAHHLGTNEKRLTRAFQTHFEMPVHAWLREERLAQARLLLTTTETPVAVIASCLGYSTQGNFARSFKERFACTPRDLRSEMLRDRQSKDDPDEQ